MIEFSEFWCIAMDFFEILHDHNPWWRDPGLRRAGGYPLRRDLHGRLLSTLQREGRRAILLFGPRQVGKTILLLQLADDLLAAGWPPHNITYFDFSDDRITRRLTAREVVEARPTGVSADFPRIFLLDEIRSAGAWDRWLKQAVDQKVGRIVATDSAASLLRDDLRESGLGRWDEVGIEGLSLREFLSFHRLSEETAEDTLERQPNLVESYLALGGFPEHALSDDLPETHRRLRSDIVERSVERDLLRAGLDVQRVKDLFVYLIRDSGAEFNAEARSRDLEADPRSVRDWIRELIATRLVVSLERWSQQPAAKLRSRQRIFAADPGLIAAFGPSHVQEPRSRARLFEAAVFRQLRELISADGRLGFFRLDEDLEIDFVCEEAGQTTAIEVTSSVRVRGEKVERLRRAAGRLGATRSLLVHGGSVEEPGREGIEAIALSRFLLAPREILGDLR